MWYFVCISIFSRRNSNISKNMTENGIVSTKITLDKRHRMWISDMYFWISFFLAVKIYYVWKYYLITMYVIIFDRDKKQNVNYVLCKVKRTQCECIHTILLSIFFSMLLYLSWCWWIVLKASFRVHWIKYERNARTFYANDSHIVRGSIMLNMVLLSFLIISHLNYSVEICS